MILHVPLNIFCYNRIMKTISKGFQEGIISKGIWTITVRDPLGNIVSQKTIENIVVTAGRNQIAKALAVELVAISDIEISHQELGTGTTTPAVGDTGLETPTGGTRKAITSTASSGKQLNITAFWAAGEATGTHEEYGTFINGTGVSNSGVLLNRVLLSSVVVLAANSLTVDGTINFNI